MEALIVFGTPVAIVWLVLYFRAVRDGKMGPLAKGNQKELDALREERNRLEARVQNLESIVCSVDLELNARLNRLAARESAIGALPPAAIPSPATAGSAPPPAANASLLAPEPSSEALGRTFTMMRRGAAPSAPLKAGQRIASRYVIERELGRGGMGAVYLASDEKLGERVALKIVSPTVADDPDAAAERFVREVSAARKVTHPNVIRIHDLIEDEGQLLLSMEYVHGQTLAAYLGRVGVLGLGEGRHLLGQICDGLGAAHAAGVVHRDLKPSNVLLDADKRVKVIDFGLAKASFLAGMTATGLIMGTPEYMAPEQVRGLACDARTDLYALGALSYHALVGRPPFAGDTPIAIGFAHVHEPPRPPRQLRADLPESVERALLTALAKEPGKRFADAAEFKRALCA